MKRILHWLLLTVILLGILTPTAAAQSEADQASTGFKARNGAWLDSIVFSVVDSNTALSQIRAGQLDIFMDGLSSSQIAPPVDDPDVTYSLSNGMYYELTFNPVGPTFPATGKLNPFSSVAIREAMNWLIDRQYLSETILHGTATPKFLPINDGYADNIRYADIVNALESEYAYDDTRAEDAISAEMLALGATKVGELWYFNSEPVVVIFLIRIDSDGTRRPMGDYVANQLEDIGFTVDRRYVTSSQASPIWVGGNPADGLWHIYTGAWSTTALDRDQGDNFQLFYSPSSAYGFSALWQAYAPSPEFESVMQQLAYREFSSLAERDQLFTQALQMSLNDDNGGSLHLWLLDGQNFTPRRAEVITSYDLAGGVGSSRLWPYVTRFDGVEGGQLRAGMYDMLRDPWNPIGGSNWMWDQTVLNATQDYGLIVDPYTGLTWPQRAESATVTAITGLPIAKTLDWVTLEFTDQIDVPADAWVDWDATTQTFITRGTAFPDGRTAQVKSTIVYPANLFTTVTWHDGSPLSAADFVMRMIMTFDQAKPESAIYDESLIPYFDAFMTNFRGLRIVSTSPLIIETYSDAYAIDAELNVQAWWPGYYYGEAPWHTIGLAAQAEADGEMAFSADKADANQIEWTNFIGGPSVAILGTHLENPDILSYIPYQPTMGTYVSAAEAEARWLGLRNWVTNQGHYWIGTGPFYLDDISYSPKTVTLTAYANSPDAAGKWDRFGEFPWGNITEIPQSEASVLDVLYTVNNGLQWRHDANWLISITPNNWYGVTTADGHVQALDLGSNELMGSLPAELGDLTEIQVLRLEDNQLSGDPLLIIPSLTQLLDPGMASDGGDGLDLDYNALTIPVDYPNLSDPVQAYLYQKDPDWHLRQAFDQPIDNTGGTLTSLDGIVGFDIPADALIGETIFTFTPQLTPNYNPSGLAFAHNSFQLTALDGLGDPVTVFAQPVTVTITYDEATLGLPEESLKLYYWDTTTSTWLDAVTTCDPVGEYISDLEGNTFSLEICHLSEFAVLSDAPRIFLPAVLR